jgi:hypothetical protein
VTVGNGGGDKLLKTQPHLDLKAPMEEWSRTLCYLELAGVKVL